ncbi:abortive infection system antitoxin AbiGi family protein [bacterium]|nr:abortive infection system antitoxin AbiGi family protein [bacterium]
MPAINSSTLFHFTKRKDTLFKILQNGLKFSYCYEEFLGDSGMAIPMICFCDIPLLRTMDHRRRYGSYVIGIDKDYLQRNKMGYLNPVFYLLTPFLVNRGKYTKDILESLKNTFYTIIDNQIKDNQALLQKFQKEGASCFGEDIHYELDSLSIARLSIRYFLAFTKQIKSPVNGKLISNYDEREWRLVLQNETNGRPDWISEISYSDFVNDKKKLNHDRTKSNNFIFIEKQDINKAITHIIVQKDKDIPQTIDLIKNSKRLFGNSEISDKEREILISKISSFDRIEKDY